jgi:hypothetical protein
MRKISVIAAVAVLAIGGQALAQGGGGGGGGAGGAGGAAGSASGASGTGGASMSGSAGTGQTGTGVGPSTGASSENTVGQANKAISPNNPSTTQPGGPNALPVPKGTTADQDPQQFDPRQSPGYQK